jgi:hypothetical protein
VSNSVTAESRSSASLRKELAQLDVDPLALDGRALVVALPSRAMETRVKPADGDAIRKRITAPMTALTISSRILSTRKNPMCGKSQPANDGASNAHQDVPDESKAVALDEQAGQPAGDLTSQIIKPQLP